MSETANNIIFAVFAVSTAICMKRGGYEWLPAILTGLLSPVVYLILFAVILFPIQLAIGKFGVSEEQIPSSVIEVTVSVGIVIAWGIGGFLLTRRKRGEVVAASATPPEASR